MAVAALGGSGAEAAQSVIQRQPELFDQVPRQVMGLHFGDALTVLQSLPDATVQCCVTSPPYWGLRSYGTAPRVRGGEKGCEHEWGDEGKSGQRIRNGIGSATGEGRGKLEAGVMLHPSTGQFCFRCGAWLGELGLEPVPDLYVAHLVAVFAEVRRVLRDDGVLWLVIGDSYARDAGKGQHKPGDCGKQDYIIKYGGGRAAAQLDFSRVSKIGSSDGAVGPADRPGSRAAAPNLKAKDLVGIPWMTAFALRAGGWYLRSDVIWKKPNCLPASIKDRPTNSYEHVFLLAKSERYHYDSNAIAEPVADSQRGRVWADRFGGSSWKERGQHSEGSLYKRDKQAAVGNRTYTGFNTRWDAAEAEGRIQETRNARDVWTIPTKPYREAHFAVFPPALVRRCLLAGSRPGDVVLDPFLGSGTVAEVAEEHGRRWIGIVLNPAYEPLIRDRVSAGITRMLERGEALGSP